MNYSNASLLIVLMHAHSSCLHTGQLTLCTFDLMLNMLNCKILFVVLFSKDQIFTINLLADTTFRLCGFRFNYVVPVLNKVGN